MKTQLFEYGMRKKPLKTNLNLFSASVLSIHHSSHHHEHSAH